MPCIIKGFLTFPSIYHTVFLQIKIKTYKQTAVQFVKLRLTIDSEENSHYPNKEQRDTCNDGDDSQREVEKLTPFD